MIKTILKSLTLLSLFFMLTAQQGCQTTSSMGEKKLSPKQTVKQDMIKEVRTQIEELGATPLTEDEAKYKGALGKDKYIVALEKQLLEIKALKQEEKNAAKKKADEAKKEVLETKSSFLMKKLNPADRRIVHQYIEKDELKITANMIYCICYNICQNRNK